MESIEFNNLFCKAQSGQNFTAVIHDSFVTGKIEVSQEKKCIWLCFNTGPDGESSPNMHSYTKSWVMHSQTHWVVKEFVLMPEKSKELISKITNDYQIY